MGGIFNPLPGGTVGRTDQGVDISASPGTPVDAIAEEQLVGVIPNWYAGQPYEWFKILSGPLKGMYNYAAEQISFVTTRIGTRFRGGQRIGVIAPSGTGTEFGFATASGGTLAGATTGYREGQATPAGSQYRSRVPLGRSGPKAGGGGKDYGTFMATAYGPPWGGIEGGGQTATGIDLSNAPHRYIVAVDPSVIPLHTKLNLDPNPFGDPSIVFVAEDTGGAIKSKRIDFYDWRGRASQNAWGMRPTRVTEAGGGLLADAAGVTRPGEGDTTDTSAQMKQFFTSYLGGQTPDVTPTATSTIPVALQGAGGTTPIGFKVGGIEIPNPFDTLSQGVDLVGSVLDFLKWIAWLFNPINVLRVVEFLTGMATIILGIWIALDSNRSSAGQTRRETRTARRTIRNAPARIRRVQRTVKTVAKAVPK